MEVREAARGALGEVLSEVETLAAPIGPLLRLYDNPALHCGVAQGVNGRFGWGDELIALASGVDLNQALQFVENARTQKDLQASIQAALGSTRSWPTRRCA